MAALPLQTFRLTPDPVTGAPPADAPHGVAPTTLGLTCGPDGPALAGAPLLRKTELGFAPPPRDELAALTLAAYGTIGDLARLTRALAATANALNRADLSLAMMAAVHLQLPDVTGGAAARLAAVADYLAKRRVSIAVDDASR